MRLIVNTNVSCVELVEKMIHITMTYIDLADTDVNFAFVDAIVHFPLKPKNVWKFTSLRVIESKSENF
jgi:hypothetical protein